MTIGLVGRKVGMTRVFLESGVSEPVTVIHIIPNRVSQVKTQTVEGYNAVQLTAGTKKPSRVNKPLSGHFAKAKIDAGDAMVEFRTDEKDQYELGQVIELAAIFKDGQFVDVAGTSKGKGFTGTVKRHNFRTQDATHGNSRSHRVPGSIGQNQSPGKVFKGKKMAGQHGNKRSTVQNLKIVRVDSERHLLLLKGAVPGFPGALVEVKPAVKIKQGGE
ncbi:MAG: 50S ribosomal protein L3 [Legionellales bacterium RIFCSPHIGHO2_12_FULL_37_14]|nr:MAG: 50S ribosomal protein L3 [Legionellales bacterium RIFCSPHIGHO2_12_FULL_37_14]